VRVKSPLIKRNPEAGALLKERLVGLAGVREVSVTPLTGSVVITHDPARLSTRELLDRLAGEGHFDPARAVTNDQYLNSAATKAGQVVGKAVLGAFVEKAFEGSALSLLAVLI
jgi:hypothetical protein